MYFFVINLLHRIIPSDIFLQANKNGTASVTKPHYTQKNTGENTIIKVE